MRSKIIVASSTALIAAVLIVLSNDLAKFLESLLPLRMTVVSSGSHFKRFGHELGFSLHIKGFAIAAIVFLPVLILRQELVNLVDRWLNFEPKAKIQVASIVVISVLAFTLYYYLASPPYAYLTNAYFHWSEIYFNGRLSKAYPLVYFTHQIFDKNPPLLQGMLASSICILSYCISKYNRVGFIYSILTTLAIIGSPMVMNFAGIAEDTLLNQTLLLLVLLVYCMRINFWLGFAMFAASLGRMQYVSIILCFVAAELVFNHSLQKPSLNKVFDSLKSMIKSRFILTNFSTFLILLIGRALYRNFSGQYSQASQVMKSYEFMSSVKAVAVSGFEIYSGSMSFILHAFWIFPIALYILIFLVFRHFRSLTNAHRALVTFVVLFFVGNCVIHDYVAGSYFNYRYLAYYLPILFVISAVVYLKNVKEIQARKLWIFFVLIFSMPIQGNYSFRTKKKAEAEKMTQLYSFRQELQAQTKESDIYTTFKRKKDLNYLAFIFRKVRQERRYKVGAGHNIYRTPVNGASVPEGGVVVTPISNSKIDCETILKTENIVVCRKKV